MSTTSPEDRPRFTFHVLSKRVVVTRNGQPFGRIVYSEKDAGWIHMIGGERQEGAALSTWRDLADRLEGKESPMIRALRHLDAPEPVAAPLTMAPTFSDDIPEPAFDILSELSGNGAIEVVIYRAPYRDCVDYVSSRSRFFGWPRIPADVMAWQLFETLDGWRWWKTGEFKRPDGAGLFLP